jgi:hypothetical protein
MRNNLRLHNGTLQRRDYRPRGNPFRVPMPIALRIALFLGVVAGVSGIALFLALAVVVKS